MLNFRDMHGAWFDLPLPRGIASCAAPCSSASSGYLRISLWHAEFVGRLDLKSKQQLISWEVLEIAGVFIKSFRCLMKEACGTSRELCLLTESVDGC